MFFLYEIELLGVLLPSMRDYALMGLAIGLGTSCPIGAELDFSRDVRPILNNNCTACHGGVKKEGDVSFIYREETLAKGKSGKQIVVPGDPDASELIRRITTDDVDDLMPPPDHGARLKKEEVETLRQWIKEGAKWGDHWSLEKPQGHEAPSVKQTDWPKNKIDFFVLSRLEERGLKPSGQAKPATLLRRLSLDLIGLPPTVEELDAFESAFSKDPSGAYHKEVERLLASPHFGERWAANWLDLARYADSEGLGTDRNRPMHPYRDWVIRAFNKDMPFDQFTVSQIAGDLLPNKTLDDEVATAFHRLTQSNEEGGTDDEEFRVIAAMDRVATTWETWQGLTFGCVQCHAHPYEPIEMDEYYKFMAFFNNTRDQDLSNHHPRIRVPHKPADFEKANKLRQSITQLMQAQVNEVDGLVKSSVWKPVDNASITSSKTKIKTVVNDGYSEFRAEDTLSRGTVFTFSIPTVAEDAITAIRLDVLPLDIEAAKHSGEWGSVLSHVAVTYTPPGGKPVNVTIKELLGDDPSPPMDARQSLNKKSSGGWGPYSKIYRPRRAVLVPSQPAQIEAGGKVEVKLSYNQFILASFPLVPRRARLAFSNDKVWIDYIGTEKYAQRNKSLAKLGREYNAIPSSALPVLEELAPKLRRETRVFERGNWLSKGELISQPDVPASLPKMKVEGKEPTRLDLARWMVSAENPLTSRVAVNRFWEQLFGYGIVETLEDFGSSGHLPSHPNLLDDLAVRFQSEMGWSVKTLLREIVMSATYRQSGKISEELREKDIRNMFLARGPRNRLTAEMVRDQALVVAGLLNREKFGHGVYPPIPSGGYTPASGGGGTRWKTPKAGNPQRYRRAVYTYIKRSSPYPSFASFDAPTRENCSKRRIVSNTPLAALTTMNDPVFSECIAAFAKRLDGMEGKSLEDKISHGYRIATSHKINAEQLAELKKLYNLIAGKETPAAAMDAVCSVLLNLDKSLTR